MLKRCIIAGTIALSSATLLADTNSPAPDFETITIPSGNSSTLYQVVIPTHPNQEAPYALTGESNGPEPLPLTYQTYGQGGPIWVPQ